MADKNLHWMFWTLPISVNWIFNGQEKDSDQHEKYLYQLLTHVKEGPKRDICNVYPAWCCNVCASGTETFHLLFLSPKCHVVGAPRIKFPITTSFFISPCCSNNLLPFSRSQRKSDEVLDSCACSDWPKNAREGWAKERRRDNWVTLSRGGCNVGLRLKLVLPSRPFVAKLFICFLQKLTSVSSVWKNTNL